jgi:hypothetical protein
MKRDLLSGFLHPADAIVPCKRCGAVEGEPCRSLPKDKDKLKPGFVHFGRRMRRLLLTAAARGDERERFERDAVKMLRQYLAERRPSLKSQKRQSS